MKPFKIWISRRRMTRPGTDPAVPSSFITRLKQLDLVHGDNIGVIELGALPSLIDPVIKGEVYYNRATSCKELGYQVKADADFAKAKELGYEP
jgi:hypothetical protein